ncbi:hypothetical protein ATO12_14215 [Aquimarina atlantica]|uniref:DUF4199 domain-containing protein n=1 Tax=Aquimarina atlantica TaxID=1317122 RepID=A0A023BVJ9_9FLAO|nr:DUF4199 domain-containing protein [Aquimarina atlantica]EZH74027.1 hypothetical protein ATO12_14215 [Aquimarina atlantica]
MENKIPTAKFSSSYGIILGMILVLIHVIMYVSGLLLDGEQWPMYLYYIIFPIFIFFAIHTFKKKSNGFLSLGQAIKIGISIAALSGLVYAIYNGIFNFFIEPDFIDQMLEVTREKMMENPNMTEEQIEMSINWAKKLGGPIIGGAFFILLSVFFGFIYSLIGGLIMQKKQDLY